MKKPKKIIALSFMLLLFGIVNVVGGAGYIVSGLPIFGLMVGLITLVQGMFALMASVGLWKLAHWAEKMFIAWASICVARFVIMRLFIYPAPFIRIIVMAGVITILFVVIHKFVYQKHKPLFCLTVANDAGVQP